jgi:hypothetical protein
VVVVANEAGMETGVETVAETVVESSDAVSVSVASADSLVEAAASVVEAAASVVEASASLVEDSSTSVSSVGWASSVVVGLGLASSVGEGVGSSSTGLEESTSAVVVMAGSVTSGEVGVVGLGEKVVEITPPSPVQTKLSGQQPSWPSSPTTQCMLAAHPPSFCGQQVCSKGMQPPQSCIPNSSHDVPSYSVRRRRKGDDPGRAKARAGRRPRRINFCMVGMSDTG